MPNPDFQPVEGSVFLVFDSTAFAPGAYWLLTSGTFSLGVIQGPRIDKARHPVK